MPGCRRLLTPLPEPWGLPPAVPKKACPYTQLNLATCNLTRVPILRDGHGHLSVVDKPDEQYVVPDSLLLDEVDEEAARKAAGDAALAEMLMGREPRRRSRAKLVFISTVVRSSFSSKASGHPTQMDSEVLHRVVSGDGPSSFPVREVFPSAICRRHSRRAPLAALRRAMIAR